MEITREQENFLNFLMENKERLEELLGEKFSPKKRVQVKDLKIGDSVRFAGLLWSKFAESKYGDAYMLADESICRMAFGKNNDWRESPIRDKLNVLSKAIKDELGVDSLFMFEPDLLSADGLDDYGTIGNPDDVGLLTYDLYRRNRKNIKRFDDTYWLCTPNSTFTGTGSDYVQVVDADGEVDARGCNWELDVRPFCILNIKKGKPT